MRFGHAMHRHFVPEWSQHYIDYNLLKCLIKLAKFSEAHRCLDAGISSLDEFLRPRLDRLGASDTALDPKKLQWFDEVNTRAVRRILAKLAKRYQAKNLSYQGLQARWETTQSTWKTQLALASQTAARLPLTENSILSCSKAKAEEIISTDNDGFTPLHLAVIGSYTQAALNMIDTLIHSDGGAHTTSIMSDILAIALRTQNDDIVHCLLSNGGRHLYHRSGRGEIALHVAVQVGRIDYVTLIVQVMGEHGASFDVPDDSRAWTPLFFACSDGNADITHLLIKAGSSQRQQDRLGWTAKEVAAYRGHLAVADLFKASSDVNASIAGGPASPLPYAKAGASNVSCGYDQCVIIATLGTTRRDQPVAGVDLSFCSSTYTPGNYEASFVLEVSVPGVSERRRVPLPIIDDQINDPFVFIVPNTDELCLVFDVIRLTGDPGKEIQAASGTALLTRHHQQFGTHRQSLVREQTASILENGTMRIAGVVTFTPLIVHPFPHLQLPKQPDGVLNRQPSTPPLLVGHRGAGQNVNTRTHLQVGENTVVSFLSASKLGASFVEFDIQLTRDLQPIAFHDFSLSESGTDVPVHDVTLDQFLNAGNVQSPRGKPPAVLGTVEPRGETGRHRSRSLGLQYEAGAMQIRDRLKHTVDFQNKGFKPNTRGGFIQDSFATLQEILLKLPQHIRCDIEIKYPRLHESVEAGVAPIAIELNKFVDVVLEQLHRDAGARPIILSSFTPEICILLAIKQRAYPVLFITNAGYEPMRDMEVRAADLQGAVHFAERWGLAGVVLACDALLLCPRLVSLVKARGLVCGTYGKPNNEPDNVKEHTEFYGRETSKNSLSCRARRIKCDEKKPICNNCDRRGIECRQADFIVHDAQSSLSQAQRSSSGAVRQVNTEPVPGYEPESTNDVVQRVQLGAYSQLEPAPRTSTHQLRLSKQCIDLVQMYQDGIGIWMDVCDDTLTYQRHVVRLSLSSELLLHSICALSAKQMSLVKERYLWEPVAADHYGTSLRLLMRDLDRSDMSRDIILAAAVLLCSYELLANPGTEYKRHMLGARTLIQTYKAMNGTTEVGRASFWIFARQDVAMAIMNETHTLIDPGEWEAAVNRLGNAEDDMGNKIIWLLARTVQLRFTSKGNFDSQPSALDGVSSAIDQWWCDLPQTTHGVRVEGESEDGLTEIWFHAPSTAAALLYYHMAKILLLELELEGKSSGNHDEHQPLGPKNAHLCEKLESHALSIASICLSRHMWEGVRPVAVNPMFYAGKYVTSPALKARVWNFLEDFERQLGFHTRSRVKQLQTQTLREKS